MTVPKDRQAWEDTIIAGAVYFTAVMSMGKGVRDRQEFKTFKEAAAFAASDPRWMVYAVDVKGHSCMVERSRWAQLMKG